MKQILFSIATTALLVASCTTQASAVTQQQMRFHCDKDTIELNELLEQGAESKLQSPNELISFYAEKLLGHPYVAHTLEGDTELLTINIDELDCTTFVETLYALTRTTLNGRTSWRDYANNLESVRYRGGTIGDYSSRLHYISEWIIDNTNRGNLEEVTLTIPSAVTTTKTINFMSTHRSSYPALANDDEMTAKIANFESGYVNHRFGYLKKEWLGSKELKTALKDGDIVCLVTKTPGLDVSHLGIIKKDDKGNLHLLDASSIGKKVQIEKDDLREQLRLQRNNQGIRVIRLKP